MYYSNALHTGLVDVLTSDTYRLLRLLASLQTHTVDGVRIRETQEEIAELFHVSKGKLNPLMKALVATGCLDKYRSRSGYVITPLGAQVIERIEALENLTGELLP